jgi:hypothetical protein
MSYALADTKKKTRLTPEAVYKLILENSTAALRKHPVGDIPRFIRTLHSIIRVESTFDPNAKGFAKTSSGWARGLSQVTDGTQTDIETHYGWSHRGGDARMIPGYSIQLGAGNLAWLLARDGGDWFSAIYKYNQGRFAKISKKSYGNTYYREVSKHYGNTDWATLERAAGLTTTPTYALLKEWY